MTAIPNNPTLAMREHATGYPEVDEGTACTQSSFKTGGRAFLFVGAQGGRFKAMFKLSASRQQARELAQQSPNNFQIGSGQWITARFSAEAPMPVKLWRKWLDESYELSRRGSTQRPNGTRVAN